MALSSCLVCLKVFQKHDYTNGTCDLPIFTKFLKVAQEYLKVSSVATKRLLRVIGDGKDGVFCENCEVTVIAPICQVYSQLLCARASLSVELEKLQVVLEDSTESVLNKVKLESTPNSVVDNAKLSYFKPFRSSLTEKCQQKRYEFLPHVIIQRLIATPSAPGVTPKKEPDVFDDFEANTCEIFELDDADTFEPFDDNDQLHSPRGSFATASREIETTELNGEESLLKREVIQEPELAIKNEYVEQHEASTLEPVSKKPKRKGRRRLLTKPIKLKCSSCSKLILNEEQLKIHNRNYHKATNCSSCGQTFSGESLFNRHWARVHSTKGKIPCPSCPKVFRKLDSLTRHRKYAHGGDSESFPCPTCSRVFPTAFRLLCHRNASHSSRVYPCDHCAMSFKSRTPLLYHLSLFHKSVATVFPCPHCIIVFKHEQNLKRHVLKRHSPTSPKPVVKKRKRKPVKTEPGVFFPCPTCGKLFKTRKGVSAHLRELHSDQQFSCQECNAVFKQNFALSRHMKAVHNPETHICEHCGKVYTMDRYLRRHVQQFHPTPAQLQDWVKCPKCEKLFYKKHLMNQHLPNCRVNTQNAAEQD